MNKKGQFFLIAAVIISVIIVSLGTVYIATKAVPKSGKQVYDLSREIEFESNKLIDHGVFNALTQEQKTASLTDLMDYYAKANPDTDLIMIYGDETGAISAALFYQERSSGSLAIGQANIPVTTVQPIDISNDIVQKSGENKILVNLNTETQIEFELEPGENFFIVLAKQIGDEKIVSA